MARPFKFAEFETTVATISTPTETTDDQMSVSKAWATQTSVGTAGVFSGSLQSGSGGREEFFAKQNMVVNYNFLPAAPLTGFSLIANGDRLTIGGNNYDIVHREDETGVNISPVIYLKRID